MREEKWWHTIKRSQNRSSNKISRQEQVTLRQLQAGAWGGGVTGGRIATKKRSAFYLFFKTINRNPVISNYRLVTHTSAKTAEQVLYRRRFGGVMSASIENVNPLVTSCSAASS
jgi:hypothetical protein